MAWWDRIKRDRKAVFGAVVGGRLKRFDPSEVRRKLDAANPAWADLAATLAAPAGPLPPGTPPEFAAKRAARLDDGGAELARCASLAFGLPPLSPDGSGYTESERLYCLGDYLHWCAGVLEQTRPFPTPPRPTDSRRGG